MLSSAQTFAAQNLTVIAQTSKIAGDSEGRKLRFEAADLFRQGRLEEAHALTLQAMHQYPDSEDVLVIRALICEVRQEWYEAATVLERLVSLQGDHAPVQSWCHWLRVLRCDGQTDMALKVALQGMKQHPGHPILASELAQLEALGARSDTLRQAA